MPNIRNIPGPVKMFLLFVSAPWMVVLSFNLGIFVASITIGEPLKYHWWPEITQQASIFLGAFVVTVFLPITFIGYFVDAGKKKENETK